MNKIGKIIGVCTTVSAMTASIIAAPYIIAHQNSIYTLTQVSAITTSYETSLKEIRNNYDITFHNAELYKLLSEKIGTDITVEKLHNIIKLELDLSTLSNLDLSDLKYLINLQTLTLTNGVVDCSNFTYNQNLTNLTIERCDFYNTSELPNSIETININESKATDYIISLPYYTKYLYLNNSISNKIYVKNPENLEVFSFNGYSFLDLSDLKDCTNLKYLYLSQCPNVSHSEYLKNFHHLIKLDLDEFCCVWGQVDDFKDLPNEYHSMICKLNKLADSLVLSDYTDEEKIEHLTLFVTSQIEYDFQANVNERLLTAYNTEPLTYALKEKRGVCVGYATLFKALANRVGLDSYQPDSINHTWNMVKKADDTDYRAYDFTQIDNKPIATGTFSHIILDSKNNIPYYINKGLSEELLYYNFDSTEANLTTQNYSTNVQKVEVGPIDTSIGYINIEAPARRTENNRIRLKLGLAELGIVIIINTLKNIIISKKEEAKKKVLYINNFRRN